MILFAVCEDFVGDFCDEKIKPFEGLVGVAGLLANRQWS
jgi:hypothetical protein